MKTKGAKRRKIPKHYIDTLVALDNCTNTPDAANELCIGYQGMHERIRRMNEWFGEVVILTFAKPILTEKAYKLLELKQSGYSDEEILKEIL